MFEVTVIGVGMLRARNVEAVAAQLRALLVKSMRELIERRAA